MAEPQTARPALKLLPPLGKRGGVDTKKAVEAYGPGARRVS